MGVYLDGRDIYWNPTKGYYVGQSVTYTGGFLFGQQGLHPHRLHAGRVPAPCSNLPVSESWNLMFVLAAHSALSMILPNYSYNSCTGHWGWQTVTDDTDQLYIDGMTVGRGWRRAATATRSGTTSSSCACP